VLARRLVIALAVATASCATAPKREPSRSVAYAHAIEGSVGDVVSVEGEYAGFVVVRACPRAVAAVIGTGEVPFEWLRRPDDASAREHLRQRVLSVLTNIKSLHASGFGVACRERAAFVLYMADYREVDDAIRAMGQWMANERLHGEVSIVVEAVPVITAAR